MDVFVVLLQLLNKRYAFAWVEPLLFNNLSGLVAPGRSPDRQWRLAELDVRNKAHLQEDARPFGHNGLHRTDFFNDRVRHSLSAQELLELLLHVHGRGNCRNLGPVS